MRWNWQHIDWPEFQYDPLLLTEREQLFQRQSGIGIGSFTHLDSEEQSQLIIELISTEALKSSEIEGEMLDRSSIQTSLRRQFGLEHSEERIKPAEQGIAEMLGDLYRRFEEPLDHETLYLWHKKLMSGRSDLQTIGRYRTHAEPMQVVSGPGYAPRVHFEAPPSSQVFDEMDQFLKWFNSSIPGEKTSTFHTCESRYRTSLFCIHSSI